MDLAVVPELPKETKMSDHRNFKESMEEKLVRLGACGMGYPALGMPCIRPKGHNPLLECFTLIKTGDEEVTGVWMTRDEKQSSTDANEFPTDLVTRIPQFEQKVEEVMTDRRGLVAHSRSKT